MRRCGCGCDKVITNEMQACFPVMPWDPPATPHRYRTDRCQMHTHCAYRDDDPTRCSRCHAKDTCTCNTIAYPARPDRKRKR